MNQPSPSLPHTYPRRILLAVAANSPQIVTETAYALARQTQPAWIPTEIHVITTCRGAGYVRAALCAAQQNQLGRLAGDYGLALPAFTDGHIHLITNAQGEPLDDVRSGSDNTHAADYITRLVQGFTADPQASLHVSLSGGRRTMTYYIGYALSLFGREQDRLSHVLVEEEFYFNQEFYYPPPGPLWVVREDGSGFDASRVEVTLADIPFVRLREGLPEALLAGSATFSASIAAAQRRFMPPSVEIRLSPPSLTCGKQVVHMAPAQLAFYVWLLQRHRKGLAPIGRADMDDPGLKQDYLHTYRQLFGATGNYEQIVAIERKDYESILNWFDERKANTNKALRKALGAAAAPYELKTGGQRARSYCSVELQPEVIDIR